MLTKQQSFGGGKMEGLMQWLQGQINPYNIQVKNYTKSWADGLAICALLHSMRPDLIDMNKIKNETPIERIRIAINGLEKAGCPILVDAEDFAYEDKSMMTYLSDIQKRLAGGKANW